MKKYETLREIACDALYQTHIINSHNPFLEMRSHIRMERPKGLGALYTEEKLNLVSHELIKRMYPIFNELVETIFGAPQS